MKSKKNGGGSGDSSAPSQRASSSDSTGRAGGPVAVHAVSEFREAVERERARATRNGHRCMVVRLKVGNAGSKAVKAKRLCEAVMRRARLTDEVGWLDEAHLGVLLFNAPKEGADRFIDDVSKDTGAFAPSSVCGASVFVPAGCGVGRTKAHMPERLQVGSVPADNGPESFRRVLERERARADRNGHGFSVVAFDAGKGSAGDALTRRLEQVTASRARATDEIGWLDKRRLCVLLYNTRAEGAWGYADSVRDALGAGRRAPQCEVYTYPTAWGACDDSAHPQGGGGVAAHCNSGGPGTPCPNHQPRAMRPRLNPGHRHEVIGTNVLALRPAAMHPERSAKPVQDLAPFFEPMPFRKRVVDVLGAAAALVLFSPVMAAVAVAIKLTSRGPVIFKQERAGLRGKPFTCYKFRSMVADAETQKGNLLPYNERAGVAFKMRNDPRVTPVGKFLRETSLDELPQFFNVLKGEMSLVGPRPLPVEEALQQDAWHNMRLEVVPGITCLWQIYARHSRCFDRWARLDIEYARKRSFLFDMKLLLLTIPAVLSRRGAH